MIGRAPIQFHEFHSTRLKCAPAARAAIRHFAVPVRGRVPFVTSDSPLVPRGAGTSSGDGHAAHEALELLTLLRGRVLRRAAHRAHTRTAGSYFSQEVSE